MNFNSCSEAFNSWLVTCNSQFVTRDLCLTLSFFVISLYVPPPTFLIPEIIFVQNRTFFNYWCYNIYERESVKVFENHSFTINLWTSNDIGHAFSLVISWWSYFDHVTLSRRQVLTSFFNEINSYLCFKSPFTPARISFFQNSKFIEWLLSAMFRCQRRPLCIFSL